jgi:hypothetical protein
MKRRLSESILSDSKTKAEEGIGQCMKINRNGKRCKRSWFINNHPSKRFCTKKHENEYLRINNTPTLFESGYIVSKPITSQLSTFGPKKKIDLNEIKTELIGTQPKYSHRQNIRVDKYGVFVSSGLDDDFDTTNTPVINTTNPTENNMTDPTENNMTDPTENNMTDPVVTDPTEINFTDPNEINITDPTEINITDPTEINITDPNEINITDPNEIIITDPTDISAKQIDSNKQSNSKIMILTDTKRLKLKNHVMVIPYQKHNYVFDNNTSEPSESNELSDSDRQIITSRNQIIDVDTYNPNTYFRE